ncbi:MAG: sel1 repeat family protein [Nitrosospira sp.]|nr:sel1 repeat family protein [Nitrosospira sp.]
MLTLKRLLLAISMGCLIATANAAPLDDAVTAYERGDYAEALKILRPLAIQGGASAQLNLGAMYDNGEGVTQDYKEAGRWYRLAAAQGDASAQYNLGVMYHNGEGVTQDYKEAVKWYRLAAAQGDAEAQYSLGVMYEKGQGVTQDYIRAHMWWNLASSAGDAGGDKNRDIVAKKMTPQQIEKAQDMARECQAKDFKEC